MVGHSLGGGIALQFAYQFPDRVDRLVLISSGGLGAEVTPLLRAATLPGAHVVVAGLGQLPEGLTRRVLPVMSLLPGLLARQDAQPMAAALRGLGGAGARRGFIRTARAVIDWRGQTVHASRHLGLLVGLPVLIAWGSEDTTIKIWDQITDKELMTLRGHVEAILYVVFSPDGKQIALSLIHI